jgi:hypothetical protein
MHTGCVSGTPTSHEAMRLRKAEASCTIACLNEAEAIRMQALAKEMGRRDLSIRVLRSSRDRFAGYRPRPLWS